MRKSRRFAGALLAAVMLIGTAYAAPGSLELAQQVRAVAAGNDAILLQNHGALTAGKNLADAFQKMEVLECVAKTIILSRLVGDPVMIPEE